MQSGSCSFSRLEMASERIKTLIFKNAEKIKNKKVNFLETVSTKDISASRKARNFFKKGKLIHTGIRPPPLFAPSPPPLFATSSLAP